MLNPMMPAGSTAIFNNTDPQGNLIDPIVNQLVNFGWEYVYHCHILSHEEMDMMRPVSVALPPLVPCGLEFNESSQTLSWIDTSLSETAFVVQKSTDSIDWTDVVQIDVPLDVPNTSGGLISYTDTTWVSGETYRVYAQNTVGDTAVPGFPTLTVKSAYAYLGVDSPPAAFSKSLPANGAIDQLLNPILTWGASSGASFTSTATIPPTTMPAVVGRTMGPRPPSA
jgi:hypothetical protein